MSVQSQIDRLNAVKNRIRTNLAAQGITVPADTTLDEMATLILSVAGYTPEKGVDYWTDADQESIVQQVITALGTPVFGRVDADNNIILTGELADGIYKLWYEDENGKMTELCTYDTGPDYINWIKRSVEADGTPYNGGQGWKANTRLSSSGAESTNDATGMEVTGFIPFKRGDVIRFSGITMNANSSNVNRCYFIQYKDNESGEKEMLKQWVVSVFKTAIELGYVTTDSDGNILQINTGSFGDENSSSVTPFYTTAQYFRISADEINDDSVITINQEIPEEEPAYTNLIPLSINSDKTPYVGTNGEDGYKTGYRLNSSGVESAQSGYNVTGFIPAKFGDVIYIKNMTWIATNEYAYCYLWAYNSGFQKICGGHGGNFTTNTTATYTADADGQVISFTLDNSIKDLSDVAYIRMSYVPVSDAEPILTINQPIE